VTLICIPPGERSPQFQLYESTMTDGPTASRPSSSLPLSPPPPPCPQWARTSLHILKFLFTRSDNSLENSRPSVRSSFGEIDFNLETRPIGRSVWCRQPGGSYLSGEPRRNSRDRPLDTFPRVVVAAVETNQRETSVDGTLFCACVCACVCVRVCVRVYLAGAHRFLQIISGPGLRC